MAIFSPRLARRLGEGGELLVLDVADQIANTRRKLARWPLTQAQVADLTEPVGPL
jgi:hypothetical protein